MDPIARETYRMHARTAAYQERLREAEESVEQAFNVYRRPVVAYSGGKDSLVMLHLALQQEPGVQVFHWDYGDYYMPRDFEDEAWRVAEAVGARSYQVETSHHYRHKRRTAEGILGRELYGRILKQQAAAGIDLSLVGLRAGESTKRARRCRVLVEHGPPMDTMFPVRHLTAADVWAYIISQDLPYLRHYDRYGDVLGIENVRLCTFFDPEFAHLGASNLDGLLMTGFKNLG